MRSAKVIHTQASAIEEGPFEDWTSVLDTISLLSGGRSVLGVTAKFLYLWPRAMCFNPGSSLIPQS